MFYDTFKRLCMSRNVSVSRAATDIGLSNSTPTKWKKTGATPDSATLQKVSQYFGVTNDYLLGFTIEAQIDNTACKIKELKAQIKMASGAEKEDIESALAVLEESYDDLCFAKSLEAPLEKETAPTPECERNISDDEIKFALFGTRDIDDDVLDRVKQFAKFAQENEKNK